LSGDPLQPKEGVPEGFYNNKYLIEINKGFQRADQKDQFPQTLPCWKEGCDKPLQVCGYPFYICDNDHAFNAKTGERWNWKGYDEVYHDVLALDQDRVEPAYQSLFYPTSKKREDTEARQISSRLNFIGEVLYMNLEIKEDDTYHWGADVLRFIAGIRFGVNMMHNAIKTRHEIEFPSEKITEEEAEQWDEKIGALDLPELDNTLDHYDADKWRTQLGDEQIKKLLLSVEEVKKELPKETSQATLF
jgi:hypothetical protein